MTFDRDEAIDRAAWVLADGCAECDGTLAAPSGVDDGGQHKYIDCPCCYGTATRIVDAILHRNSP